MCSSYWVTYAVTRGSIDIRMTSIDLQFPHSNVRFDPVNTIEDVEEITLLRSKCLPMSWVLKGCGFSKWVFFRPSTEADCMC